MTLPLLDAEPIRLRPPRHRVAPRALRWWTLRALIGSLVQVGAVAFGYALTGWTGLAVALAVIGPLAAAYVVVMPRWRYLVHRWETTDQAVYAASGWIVREWRVAPISRIQTVDTQRGPLEQLLGLATLTVTTASSAGAVRVAGLAEQDARRAAAELTAITEATPGDAT